MKTKEFIERVEALNFVGKAEKGISGLIGFPNKNGEALISVNEDLAYHFNTNYKAFRQLHLRDKRQLANIAWEYASTPLEEREEEKKYIYIFPFHITARNVETKHICRNHTFRESGESNDLIIDLSPMDTVVTNEKFLFTDKEVEQYTGKDRELFNVCEKIEVTSND